jgi:hypothetical protein
VQSEYNPKKSTIVKGQFLPATTRKGIPGKRQFLFFMCIMVPAETWLRGSGIGLCVNSWSGALRALEVPTSYHVLILK